MSDVIEQHKRMVAILSKPGEDVLTDLTPHSANALHMAVGVSGEAGELLDAIKKHAIYCRDVDLENVIEELGDVEFYLEGIRTAFNISREDTLKHNLGKLLTGSKARYAEQVYSNTQAQTRQDKEGEELR